MKETSTYFIAYWQTGYRKDYNWTGVPSNSWFNNAHPTDNYLGRGIPYEQTATGEIYKMDSYGQFGHSWRRGVLCESRSGSKFEAEINALNGLR